MKIKDVIERLKLYPQDLEFVVRVYNPDIETEYYDAREFIGANFLDGITDKSVFWRCKKVTKGKVFVEEDVEIKVLACHEILPNGEKKVVWEAKNEIEVLNDMGGVA